MGFLESMDGGPCHHLRRLICIICRLCMHCFVKSLGCSGSHEANAEAIFLSEVTAFLGNFGRHGNHPNANLITFTTVPIITVWDYRPSSIVQICNV